MEVLMSSLTTLKDYTDAASGASDRGRFVLIVMITISVLAFGAFWNSWQGSWVNARLNEAKDAYRLKVWDYHNKSLSNPDSAKIFDEAHWFVQLRGLEDSTRLKEYLGDLQKIQLEQIMQIHVPFFGMTVDVNDLGILGGLAFVVVLIWMNFSLMREANNLTIAFNWAKVNGALGECYRILTMRQVLTLPIVGSGIPRNRFWQKIPKSLLLLPAIVQLLIFCYDVYSNQLGLSISLANTIILYVLSFCFLVLITILTYLCFELTSEIDKIWKDAYKEIVSTQPDFVI